MVNTDEDLLLVVLTELEGLDANLFTTFSGRNGWTNRVSSSSKILTVLVKRTLKLEENKFDE